MLSVEHAQQMRGDLRVHSKTVELASPVAAADQNSVSGEVRRLILAEERLMRALAREIVAPLGRE